MTQHTERHPSALQCMGRRATIETDAAARTLSI